MNENKYNNEDTCICCGDTIPEGRQVCKKCEYINNHKYNYKSICDIFIDDDKEDNNWEDELYNN